MGDTICAISTAPGVGGIGIVRMSGKNSLEIIHKIFKSKKNRDIRNSKSYTLNYGYIYDPKDNRNIDEVLVSIMRAPKTYTSENIVEINCHGGIVVVKKVLELCLKYGARIAEPGEFTKRAFLNGKIDLSQAEAVIDLINAKADLGLGEALNQLQGNISVKIKEIKDKLISLMAHISASIDFPEYDIEDVTTDLLENNIKDIISDLEKTLKDADKGRIIREGLKTVIIGKPNVGKSSLLNTLLKENRAIVTEIPGTTRDIIEEYISVGGIPLKIVDTAGIRTTDDIVEKIGVEKSREATDNADLIIFILDNSEELSKNDIEIANIIKYKKVIIVINKIDLESKLNEDRIKEILPDKEIIKISIKEDKYIENIEKSISNMFFEGHIDIKNDNLITNVRHKDLLQKTKDGLGDALISIENGMPLDMVSIDLKNAIENLGYIIGESISEEIIKEIFTRFCIGK